MVAYRASVSPFRDCIFFLMASMMSKSDLESNVIIERTVGINDKSAKIYLLLFTMTAFDKL